MTLLIPLYLTAAAGVLVPILVHLFGRPRPRRVRFPSLHFLLQAQRRRHSPVRVERLLSLILRCLALVLLAMVLALPITRARWLGALGRPMGTLTLLIDNSASMRGAVDRESRISRARTVAATVLEHLEGHVSVRLAVGASSLDVLAEAGEKSIVELRRTIAGVQASDQRGRLGQQIARLISESADTSPTIVLITDLQATSIDAVARGAVKPGTTIIMVDVGDPGSNNKAVTEARSSSTIILRGRPLAIDAHVAVWDDRQTRPMSVALEVAGMALASAITTPAPGRFASARLEFTPDRAGVLTAVVRIPDDKLSYDNRRFVAALVLDRLRVAIVGDDQNAHFLRAALNPFPAGDQRSVVKVRRLLPEEVQAKDLSGLDALLLAQPTALSDAGLAAVADVLKDGTGVLVFAGPDADKTALNDRVLPALGMTGICLGEPRHYDDGLALAELQTRQPPLTGFAEAGAADLMAARFTQVRPVWVEDATPTVLARFDDGTPALIASSLGRGTALLFATSPDDAWSDLPRLPAWVPLVHELTRFLAAGHAITTLAGAPGEVCVGSVPVDASHVRIVGPDDTEADIIREDGCWRFVPGQVGTWRVEADGKDIAALAVNIDPAESDPTRPTASDLAAALAPAQVQVVKEERIDVALRQITRPVDISGLFALMALLVLAVETVMVRGTEDRKRTTR